MTGLELPLEPILHSVEGLSTVKGCVDPGPFPHVSSSCWRAPSSRLRGQEEKSYSLRPPGHKWDTARQCSPNISSPACLKAEFDGAFLFNTFSCQHQLWIFTTNGILILCRRDDVHLFITQFSGLGHSHTCSHNKLIFSSYNS